MRKDLFDELVASVKEMKDIQARRAKPSRITHTADLQETGTPGVAAPADVRARSIKYGLSDVP